MNFLVEFCRPYLSQELAVLTFVDCKDFPAVGTFDFVHLISLSLQNICLVYGFFVSAAIWCLIINQTGIFQIAVWIFGQNPNHILSQDSLADSSCYILVHMKKIRLFSCSLLTLKVAPDMLIDTDDLA